MMGDQMHSDALGVYGKLATEMEPWLAHNFPMMKDNPDMLILGLWEEWVETLEAESKGDLGDEYSDVVIYLASFFVAKGWDFREALTRPLHDSSAFYFEHPTQALGRMSRHALKAFQGIRGTQQEHEDGIKACAKKLVLLLDVECARKGLDPLHVCVAKKWARVNKRDWVEDAQSGGQEKP